MDPRETLLAQYANSPTIVSLVDSLYAALSADVDIDEIYRRIFNVHTANKHGLDIWGRIVGASRYLRVESSAGQFGFAEQRDANTPDNATPQPFNALGAMRGDEVETTIHRLEDGAYRRVILAKAASNIGDTSAYGINRVLLLLFDGVGHPYVRDNGDMTLDYVFDFPLSVTDMAMVTNMDVVPRPAGVLVRYLNAPKSGVFGFAGSGLQPFGSGTFYSGN